MIQFHINNSKSKYIFVIILAVLSLGVFACTFWTELVTLQRCYLRFDAIKPNKLLLKFDLSKWLK